MTTTGLETLASQVSGLGRSRALRASKIAVMALALLIGHAKSAAADAVADFYVKKPIRMLIGFSTGGGYDLYARLLARYLGKHIPGNPTILPENMPGAGSLRVANYLYSVAPKDGSVIGTFNRGLAMEGLLNHSPGLSYDAAKFNWLGSITNEVSVCAFRKESGIATWQDMLTKTYVVGGTASGADTDIYPTVLKNAFNLKLKLITGFPGGTDVGLAMERREVDGRCGWSWSTLMSRDRALYENKDILVPLQLALVKHPDLPNVPLITELSTDPKIIAVLKLIASRQTMARPFAAPPGLPADRANALKTAFDATMKDPDFLAEAKKLDLEVMPVGSADLTNLVRQLADSPPDVLELASRLLQEPK